MDNHRLAKMTVLVWALYPTSVFLFAPYTDALFACLALGSLLSIRHQRWFVGGSLAAMAALARAQGVLLGIPMAVEILLNYKENRGRNLGWALFSLMIIPIGWAGYMLWRQQRGLSSVSDSFAVYSGVYFADPVTTLASAFRQAVETGEVRVYLELFSLLGFGAVLVWMLTQKKFRQHAGLMAYSIATLLLFLIKHSQTASVYQSATRYVLSLFPIFIGIGDLVLKLPQVGQKVYLVLSLSGLVVVSALYALFVFVG